ncbi:MAG: hypothetical protein H0T18_04930 [Chloroflexia bacterium]|nr:hypothetical protein [Chloroflexia bacterium]
MHPPHPSLVKKTIERMVQRYKPLDLSGPWSFVDAEPEEARLVLDVLLDTFDWTGGRVWLTRDLARWIVRVRTASPDIPAPWAYAFGLAYRLLNEQEDGRHLDLALAATPWIEGRWSHEQWERVIDASPAPEKLHTLLMLGAYETRPDGENVRFRWLPPFEPWMTSSSSLKRVIVDGSRGQRQLSRIPEDPTISKRSESGDWITIVAPDSRLTAESSQK